MPYLTPPNNPPGHHSGHHHSAAPAAPAAPEVEQVVVRRRSCFTATFVTVTSITSLTLLQGCSSDKDKDFDGREKQTVITGGGMCNLQVLTHSFQKIEIISKFGL